MDREQKYQIFISYRRDGGEDLATLLEDRFTRLGYKVFYDVESLRSGDFNTELLRVIEECTDILLVLPPHGLDRCITDPEDWVKKEIIHALQNKKNIIPIMKRNFEFPENLPPEIEELKFKNGVAANMDYFDAVIDRIATKFLVCKPQNGERADDQLLQLVSEGDASAANEMALRYEYGTNTIVPNQKKALTMFEKAAKLGSTAAMFNIAEIYERCQDDLTLISDFGISIQELNRDIENVKKHLQENSEKWYIEAAKTEYAPALFKLGYISEKKGDYTEAFEFYIQSAGQNFPPAVNAVGFYYMNGIGIDQDFEVGLNWYQKAVELGYGPAIYNYARAIELKEPDRAMNLYKSVAYGDNAIPEAAYALGQQYEQVYGDIRNAIICYRIAADAGIREATEAIEKCKNTLI